MFGKDQGGYDYGYGSADDFDPLPPPPPPPVLPTVPWSRPRGYAPPHRFLSRGYPPQYPRYSAHGPPEVHQPPIPGEEYYHHPLAPPPRPPPFPSLRPPPLPPLPPDYGSVPSHRYLPPQRQPRPQYHNFARFPPPPPVHRGFRPRNPYDPPPRPPPFEHFPRRFPAPHPFRPPFQPPVPEETVRVKRTFIHDTFVPSNYDDSDWSFGPTAPISTSTLNRDIGDQNSKHLPPQPPPPPSPPSDRNIVEEFADPLGADKGVVATPTPVPPADVGQAPLNPPPMPPMFNWRNSNIEMPENITELTVSNPNLHFVPVPADKINLVQMAKAMEEEKEAANAATINILMKQGFISSTWPKELLDMFQPLYCKLCTLTLSSAIVATDHYKGKKHKKGIEKWLHDHRQPKQAPLVQNIIRARNLYPTGMASARLVSGPGSGSNPSLFSIPTQQPPSAPESTLPITGSNATPLGDPGGGGGWRKRPMNSPAPSFQQPGSSKRFPLGRPPPKKPKSDPNAGPSFGRCDYCRVRLTSQKHYDQHHAGKMHQRKVQEYEKRQNCFNLQTHEPYAAPTRPLIRPGLNVSFPSYF